jgi:hypothetical protein
LQAFVQGAGASGALMSGDTHPALPPETEPLHCMQKDDALPASIFIVTHA